MRRLRIRGIAPFVVALAAVFGLSACGSGLDAQTNQVYQAAVGADHRGHVWVLDTMFVAELDGSATLSASITNKHEHEQYLTDVTVTDSAGDELDTEQSGLPQQLPAERPQRVGVEDSPVVRVQDKAKPGYSLTVTLSFSDAPDLTFDAPVIERTATYDEIVDSTDGDPDDSDSDDSESDGSDSDGEDSGDDDSSTGSD